MIRTIFTILCIIGFLVSPLNAEQDIIRIKPSDIFSGISEPSSKTLEQKNLTSPSRIVLDNAAFYEMLRQNAQEKQKAEEQQKIDITEIDIEGLRKQLLATATPTHPSGMLYLPLNLEVLGRDNLWSESEVNIIFDYDLPHFYASISCDILGENRETITFLKNSESRERFPLKKGRYRLWGRFWLAKEPRQEIFVDLGSHVLEERNTYHITLDKRFERELFRELDIRKQLKQKSEAKNRKTKLVK